MAKAASIESDRALSQFLPYQAEYILDDARMLLTEKANRIGFTWADAFKNVRLRLIHPKRDYLFATKDQESAMEYIRTCMGFVEVYKLAKAVVSHGEEIVRIPRFVDGQDSGFVDDVKIGKITFDNGSRIIAFSSNPNAMAVYGGDVGLDEFAFHPHPEALWATASTRVTWGYNIGAWSAHNGNDSLFYQFCLEAQAGKGGWKHRRITIDDAISGGLVELINRTRGTNFTREQFREDCRERSRLEEVFRERYLCEPQGSSSALASWAVIAQNGMEYEIERAHLEAAQIEALFGTAQPGEDLQRSLKMSRWVRDAFPQVFATPAKYRLGYDVAASGEGDLACVYLDEKRGAEQVLRALLTFRTDDWTFHKAVMDTFHRGLAALRSCGDETGLGRQVCWTAAKDFPGQFTPVNFSTSKSQMGFELMMAFAETRKRYPKNQPDIPADFFAVRKHHSGGNPGKWLFSEGRNPLNAASHCDLAWAGGLAQLSGQQNEGMFVAVV